MKNSFYISSLMFDYENLSFEEIENICKKIPLKIIRWLIRNHPDNQIRMFLFKFTKITIGEDTVINIGFTCDDNYKKKVFIGKRVSIAANVHIIAESSPNNSILATDKYRTSNIVRSLDVVIKNDS